MKRCEIYVAPVPLSPSALLSIASNRIKMDAAPPRQVQSYYGCSPAAKSATRNFAGFAVRRGELGKRVYESVSKDAWKLWLEHSKMVMNEYRLNPLDPNSQKIMEEQMEQFFFGEGSKLPEGYVPPKAKG